MKRNFYEEKRIFSGFKNSAQSRCFYILVLLVSMVFSSSLFARPVLPENYTAVLYYYYDNPDTGNNERQQLTYQDLAAARQRLPQGKRPVLFVHGHNFGVEENFKNSWIESKDYAAAPTFKMHLDKPENAYLNIEGYYIHFGAAGQDRSIVEDAREIGQAINLILMRHDAAFNPADANSDTGVKVSVIAHSKGTISTRVYLKSLIDQAYSQQYNLPGPRANFKPVSEFIALSPPNHGTMCPFFSYEPDPTTVIGKAQKDWNGLALRQIYNGYGKCNLFRISKPFDLDPDTPGIQYDLDSLDFIEKLNGHPIGDTKDSEEQRYASEAPGSRANGSPPDQGVLYVCLYANNKANGQSRDSVGGNTHSDDCIGRKLAKNLAPDAEYIVVPEIQGNLELVVHKNTVHTPEVICKALYIAAYHKVPPPDFTCDSPNPFEVIPVLDHSGSMAGYALESRDETKIAALKRAAGLFVDLLGTGTENNENKFGLVRFSTEAVTGMPLTQFDRNAHDTAHTKISSLTPYSLTSIGDGLKKALIEFRDRGDNSKEQAILLLSDGQENTSPWISDVQDDIFTGKIKVYSVGFGYGSGINQSELSQLASDSGGQYHITADNLVLSKFFCQVLGNLVGWQVLYDPVITLQPGDKKSHPVQVGQLDEELIFAVYWTGDKNALGLTLCRPSPDSAGNCIEVPFTLRNNYAYVAIKKSKANWTGSWEVRVEAQKPVTYSLMALSDSIIRLETGFDKKKNLTGEEVRVWAKISGAPGGKLPATIKATCDRPLKGVGNVLHDFTYDPVKLKYDANKLDIDPVNLKLDTLRQQSGTKEILPRGCRDLVLFDDGLHRDGKAGDGFYANSFVDTQIQGSYTFYFQAEKIPDGWGGETRREWVQSLYNEVKIEPKFSVASVNLVDTISGDQGLIYLYQVKVTPRDRFGNYLGPGHSLDVNIKNQQGGRSETLEDFIDGIYGKVIHIPRSQVKSGAELHIGVKGETFTIVKRLPTPSDWSMSLHGAAAFPIGNYKNLYNQSYGFFLDLDYRLSSRLSLLGLLGYSRFNSASAMIPDTGWWNLSANFKYRFPRIGFIPYINGGSGLYIPGSGSPRMGLNFGAGLDYPFTPRWSIEVGSDYHHIFTPGPDVTFFTTHLGLIRRF